MLGFQGGVSIPLVKGGVKAPPAKRQCRAGPKAGARRGFTYTMLLLMATYGLRVSEIAALTLDDLHWRDEWMCVPRCKTRRPLHLPLTDRVGTALVQYVQTARPAHVP